MTLARRTYSAGRWTATSSIVRSVLQLVQVAVLARFLAPHDYGLMALVTLVISYVGLFSDFGLGGAFMHRQEISQAERSSLYWFTVLLGASLMLLVIAIGPLAASFFNEPQLATLMSLVATNFLVIPIGQQLRIDAEKSLNFRPVVIIEILASLLGLLMAVLAAWMNFGVYALVLASMVSVWLTTFLSWSCLSNGWRPAMRFSWQDLRGFMGFGGGLVFNHILNHITTTIDIILSGRLLGASQLGLYSLPRNLTLQVQYMINPIFVRIGFPVIASIQNDTSRVKHVYLRMMRFSSSVNAPVYIVLAMFAPEIIMVLLGPKWGDSASLLRLLAIWGLLRSFGNPVGSLLLGLGRVGLSVKWSFALVLVMPPVVWFGSKWGAIGIAWAMVILMLAQFVPAWALLIRPTCGAGLWEYSRQVVIPTSCAFCAVLVGWFVALTVDSILLRLILGLSVSASIYFLVSYIFNREFVESLWFAIVGDNNR